MHLHFVSALEKLKFFSNTETNKGHDVLGNNISKSVWALQHFSE